MVFYAEKYHFPLFNRTVEELKKKYLLNIIFLFQVYAILGVVSQYQLYSSSANSSAATPGPKLNNDDFYDIEQVTSNFSMSLLSFF